MSELVLAFIIVGVIIFGLLVISLIDKVRRIIEKRKARATNGRTAFLEEYEDFTTFWKSTQTPAPDKMKNCPCCAARIDLTRGTGTCEYCGYVIRVEIGVDDDKEEIVYYADGVEYMRVKR